MPRAICVQCGEKKEGAFTPCVKCGFDPARADKQLQAQSLWLSEDQLRPDALEKVARQIKSGQKIAADPKSLDTMMRQLQTQQNLVLRPKSSVGCAVIIWVGVALVIIAGIVGYVLLTRR